MSPVIDTDKWRGGYAHFTEAEMRCPCGCGGLPRHSFMLLLVTIREEYYTLTKKGLPVSSGYRCPAYSVKVGGSATDSHTLGVGIDSPLKNPFVRVLVDLAIKYRLWGIGIAPDHIHIDNMPRLSKVIWSE